MHELRVIFNEQSASYEKGNKDYNLFYVNAQIHYILDLLKVKGYIYDETICAMFDMAWDYSKVNRCFISDYTFTSEVLYSDDGIEIVFRQEN